MSATKLLRFHVADPTHGEVPCAAVVPAAPVERLPICAFLYGGGGSRESLAVIEPLLSAWWAAGTLPPMIVATPDVGPMSFYLDDPARGIAWESFVASRFVADLRRRFGATSVATPLGLVGISMGGYGALKIAFAEPQRFVAVAAVSPMIEPALDVAEVRPRNCFHYPPDVPAALLGPIATRDAALYRRDHPAARALADGAALRSSALAIYVDAAGRDALNAHDGAEHLHRVLWHLDVAHEYRLRRDADHVGPTLVARLRDAFEWVGRYLSPPPTAAPSDDHRAWLAIRAQLEPMRAAAERRDPSVARRYGLLPAIE